MCNCYIDTRWKPCGTTIAGGNGSGPRLDRFACPCSLCLDEQTQTIFIADYNNHRVVEWTKAVKMGRVVAGGYGSGNGTSQLNCPTDVIIDRENESLIVADQGNRSSWANCHFEY